MKHGAATKLLLETIQVGRHVGQLGLRPLGRVAERAVHAGEEMAFWALKLQPLEGLLGRQRVDRLVDFYQETKGIVAESVNSLSHQSRNSALQSGAEAATACLQTAGVQARVVGPFDEHWKTHRVLSDLRTVSSEREAKGGPLSLRLTPQRFVRFMRDVQRKKRVSRQRDPIEDYIEWMFTSGSLNRLGPMFFEKKIYMDVARVICFAFDQALREANGTDLWGHVLRVKVAKESADAEMRPHRRTNVGFEQVEAIVDMMLKCSDLKAPQFMASIQRQLLMNCTLVILQLIEDLSSDRHMQVSLLGHALRIGLDPIPMDKLWENEDFDLDAKEFKVNEKAVEEFVDALLEDQEVQFVLVPDMLEAEVYRYVIRMVISIGQFVLSRFRIRVFGLAIRLNLEEEATEYEQNERSNEGESVPKDSNMSELLVSQQDVQVLLDRLEIQRKQLQRELYVRRRGEADPMDGEDDGIPEFQKMAALDRMSRSLEIHRDVAVPIDMAFRVVSELSEYPKWLPVTSVQVTSKDSNHINCVLGIGFNTGTPLGTVGDKIRYRVLLSEPAELSPQSSAMRQWPQTGENTEGMRVARIVADTVEEFAYGKRLVYDWRFAETSAGKTEIRLSIFFQARSVMYLPLWDSAQAVFSGYVVRAFEERAAKLSEQSQASANAANAANARDDASAAASEDFPPQRLEA